MINLATLFLCFTIVIYIVNLVLYFRAWLIHKENKIYEHNSPKISILVPAYNEEVNIIESLVSMSKQTYKNFNVIVINDGSCDNTLDKIINHFKLVPCHLTPNKDIHNYKSVRKIYCGVGIIVIDKENGGKSDALNAGFAFSDAEYILSVDGDTLLDKNCLETLISKKRPDADAVATMVGISNDNTVVNGEIKNPIVPKGFWARVQWLEYNRGYVLLRDSMIDKNCVTVISGACSLVKSEMILRTGGYVHNHLGEDMEHTLNIHKQGGKVQYLNEILSWTEVPDNIKDLAKQRVRWFRGALQSYIGYISLLFNRKNKSFGFFVLPYIWVSSVFTPWIVMLGLIFSIYNMFMYSSSYGVVLWLVIIILHFTNSLFAFMFVKFKLKLYENYKGILFINLIEGFTFHYFFTYWAIKAHILELLNVNRNWNKLERKGFN